MFESATGYIDGLIATLRAVSVTDAHGAEVGLDEAVAEAIARIRRSCDEGGKIAFIGNGGSASIASHFAIDFWHAGGMRSVCFNEAAQLTCLANDHGFETVFARPVSMFLDRGDILVAISSSGQSMNILNATEEARRLGCEIISFSGFQPDNPLRSQGALNFFVPAAHYGFVESLHKTLIHAILDLSGRQGPA
jgi:D-sedoheptulose 7-phosphate isomerase